MALKSIIICSTILLIKDISAQYLNYGNLNNGLPNTYTTNLAANNLASSSYAANGLVNSYEANNLAANAATNNLLASNPLAGSNLALGNNLASIIVSSNVYDNLATNSLINIPNSAPNAISSTAALLEGITASNGGVFSVTSTSPIYPSGLSVFSNNLLIEGPVAVSGQLPFLSAVALEGTVASNGQGVAGCGCGDGNIGIVEQLSPNQLYGGLGRGGLGRYY